MKVKMGSKAEGLFRIQKHDEFGVETLDTGWFGNLILDQGITRVLTNTSWSSQSYNILRLGSGNSAPTPEQSSLDNQTVVTPGLGNGANGYNSVEGYRYRRFTHQFGQGVAAGNHSEIGAGWSASINDLFSRALIVDGEGNPTTITVLPNEFLTISYELRDWWEAGEPFLLEYDDDGTPAVTTVTPNKSHTNQEMAISGAPYMGPLGIGTRIDYDTSRVSEGIVSQTFTWGLEQGNPSIGAVAASMHGTDGTRQFSPGGLLFTFDPPIPKTNEFVVNITFEISFGRR